VRHSRCRVGPLFARGVGKSCAVSGASTVSILVNGGASAKGQGLTSAAKPTLARIRFRLYEFELTFRYSAFLHSSRVSPVGQLQPGRTAVLSLG
jgi:hypothetical protein